MRTSDPYSPESVADRVAMMADDAARRRGDDPGGHVTTGETFEEFTGNLAADLDLPPQ